MEELQKKIDKAADIVAGLVKNMDVESNSETWFALISVLEILKGDD